MRSRVVHGPTNVNVFAPARRPDISEADGLREAFERKRTKGGTTVPADQLRSEHPVYLVHEVRPQKGRSESTAAFN